MLTRPDETYEQIKTDGHVARTWPNARLAGLITKPGESDEKSLVPLLFAEVKLSPPASGGVPHLSSRVTHHNYVFIWDERRQTGYLLVRPPVANVGS